MFWAEHNRRSTRKQEIYISLCKTRKSSTLKTKEQKKNVVLKGHSRKKKGKGKLIGSLLQNGKKAKQFIKYIVCLPR